MRNLLHSLVIFLALISAITISCNTTDKVDIDETLKKFKKYIKEEQYDSAVFVVNKLIDYHQNQSDDSLVLYYKIAKSELARSYGDRETGLEILKNIKETIEQQGESENAAYYYNRKAAILYELGRYDEALEAVAISQKIDTAIGQPTWRNSSNLVIKGAVYRDRKEFTSAQEVLKEAVDLAVVNNDSQEYCLSMYNLISSFYYDRDYDSVLLYGKKNLPYIKSVESASGFIHTVENHMAKAFYYAGQKDSAFWYADGSYNAISDHWLKVMEENILGFKAREALNRQKIDNEVLEMENSRQSILSLLLITVIIGIGFITLLINRQRKKNKALLESKEELNTQLLDSLAFNNKLIGIVAHDIRNPLVNITSIIELYREGELDKKTIDELLGQLGLATQKANHLLENLLRWVKSQDSEFKPQYSNANLKTEIVKVLEELHSQVRTKGVKIDVDIDGIEFTTDRDFVRIILRNILTNSIKFSKAGQTIKIISSRENQDVVIKVIDEGVGMTQEQLNKINAGTAFTEGGTSLEKGTGIGIKLMRDLAVTLGGSVLFESVKEQGTTVTVILPNNPPEA